VTADESPVESLPYSSSTWKQVDKGSGKKQQSGDFELNISNRFSPLFGECSSFTASPADLSHMVDCLIAEDAGEYSERGERNLQRRILITLTVYPIGTL